MTEATPRSRERGHDLGATQLSLAKSVSGEKRPHTMHIVLHLIQESNTTLKRLQSLGKPTPHSSYSGSGGTSNRNEDNPSAIC
jgi:hypothetical protein